MHPQVLGVSAYALFLVIGDAIGIGVAVFGARRARIPIRDFLIPLVVLTLCAFVGAKLFGVVERGATFGSFRAELISGYRYPGGIGGFVIGLMALRAWRRQTLSTGLLADIMAPAFGFAMAAVRVGCLLAGCCSGTVSMLPWTIQFPAQSQVWHSHVAAGLLSPAASWSVPIHPLQVYFALSALALGTFALWFQRHKRYDGEVFLCYAAGYGLTQFGLEFWRFSPLPYVQWTALAIGLGCMAVFVRLAVNQVHTAQAPADRHSGIHCDTERTLRYRGGVQQHAEARYRPK